MKRLNHVLLAIFLSCGVYAEYQAEDGCPQPVPLEVVVWVNENGVPFSTETNRITPTSEPQQHPLATVSQVSSPTLDANTIPIAPVPTDHQNTPLTDQPVTTGRIETRPPPPPPPPPYLPAHAQPQHPPHPQPEQHPEQYPEPHPYAIPDRKFGISYSPYNADGSCKNQEQVNRDIEILSDYSYVRIYGTDCDQTKLVTTAARQHNMQVFAGIYDLTGFPDSLNPISEVAANPDGTKDWSIFHTIAIGNELVNGGTNSPTDVTKAVHQARSILRDQGYHGPVVTVDTFSILIKHPELCVASDYCAANCHAFFDATQHPANAGPYALEQAHAVSAAADGKRTLITESGWPHAGQANGVAVPSQENQRVAIESLRRSFRHRKDDLVLFTAFDDLWKDDNRYTFNAERFWGIYDR